MSRSVYRDFPNVSRYLEEKLFRRRKELKLSQTALAERAGVTRNCIQQLECYEHLPLPQKPRNTQFLAALLYSLPEGPE